MGYSPWDRKDSGMTERVNNIAASLWRRKCNPVSILARKIPWTEEPGRLLSMGSHRVGHD